MTYRELYCLSCATALAWLRIATPSGLSEGHPKYECEECGLLYDEEDTASKDQIIEAVRKTITEYSNVIKNIEEESKDFEDLLKELTK